MSLINEALKRTRDTANQAGQPRPAGVEPYRVSATAPAASRRKTKPIVWMMLGVVVVIGLAGVFAFSRNDRTIKAAEETLKLPAPAATPVVPPVVAVAVPAVPVAPTIHTPEPAAAPAPVPVAPPEPPKLTLQGITIDPVTGREALISGVTVRVGEEIDGAKVLAIEARRVVLTFHDHELTLRMP